MTKQLKYGASVPSTGRAKIIEALNAVSNMYLVDPAAIAAVIHTESVWDTRCVTGKYIGLTQVGPELVKKLGLTKKKFLDLSASEQIAGYGTWLGYYQFPKKMSKHKINVAALPLPRQAALLQAMQFSPNGEKWKAALSKGDLTVRSTASKQAAVLGDTSIGDMERYYVGFFSKHPPAYEEQIAARLPQDIVPTSDPALSEAMLSAYKDLRPLASPARRQDPEEEPGRYALRLNLVEPRASDPTGFERIIGVSDLTSINYLARGQRAAAAVCRIRVPTDGDEWYGSGFLVGPRLLMTNHHVLGNRGEASQAEAEFGYEHDVDGVLQGPIQFNLCPHEIFYSDPELDVTLVSVSPLSNAGVPLDRYGWLPLLPVSGKAIDKEWVTIIQHPRGGPKQISIRSNRIVTLSDEVVPGLNREHFIHYLTDTEPGSSGAPVVNDQWQVVALHHKAVARPQDSSRPAAEPVWIGNEGVRISAICGMLERRRLEAADAGRALDRLELGLSFSPMRQTATMSEADGLERDAKPFARTRWNKGNGLGYDASFLSETIDLDGIYAQARVEGLVAPLLDGSGDELKYNHFSVVVHSKRKFALLTAVNIDGKKLKHPGARQTVWRQDGRMHAMYQPDGNFYEKDKGSDKIQFSRGHLVRRFDPSWGKTVADAKLGDQDTFHYTNAAPQFQTYNDVDWGNLEDYVLDQAQITERKLSVFQGPIFRKDDPFYGKDREGGPWRVPLSFWKIAVLQKGSDQISAAAFIIGQTQYVGALYEAKVFSGLRPYRLDDLRSRKIQTTIKTVEKETGLDFAMLRRFDAHGSLESTRQTRWINRLDDVLI